MSTARTFYGDWDLVARVIDTGGTINPPVLPSEPQAFTFGGAQPGNPSPVDAVIGPRCSLATVAPTDGTLTISTPEPEGARLLTLSDMHPLLTLTPAPRATLEALRDAIDRALAEPRVVETVTAPAAPGDGPRIFDRVEVYVDGRRMRGNEAMDLTARNDDPAALAPLGPVSYPARS